MDGFDEIAIVECQSLYSYLDSTPEASKPLVLVLLNLVLERVERTEGVALEFDYGSVSLSTNRRIEQAARTINAAARCLSITSEFWSNIRRFPG